MKGKNNFVAILKEKPIHCKTPSLQKDSTLKKEHARNMSEKGPLGCSQMDKLGPFEENEKLKSCINIGTPTTLIDQDNMPKKKMNSYLDDYLNKIIAAVTDILKNFPYGVFIQNLYSMLNKRLNNAFDIRVFGSYDFCTFLSDYLENYVDIEFKKNQFIVYPKDFRFGPGNYFHFPFCLEMPLEYFKKTMSSQNPPFYPSFPPQTQNFAPPGYGPTNFNPFHPIPNQMNQCSTPFQPIPPVFPQQLNQVPQKIVPNQNPNTMSVATMNVHNMNVNHMNVNNMNISPTHQN